MSRFDDISGSATWGMTADEARRAREQEQKVWGSPRADLIRSRMSGRPAEPFVLAAQPVNQTQTD